MKKKIISLLLVSVCYGCSCLVGCDNFENKDVVNENNNISMQNNRFIDTGDVYYIGDLKYNVKYDRLTNIVYLSNNNASGSGSVSSLTPFIGSNKEPMTLDEYNETK